MIKKIALLTFLALLLLAGCKQNNTSSSNDTSIRTDSNAIQVTVDSIQKKQSIQIDRFSKAPETDTCSCLYAVDSASFTKKEYIFAYDLALTAYMKINDEMVTFKQTEFTNSGEKNSLTYFSSARYKMILESGNAREIGKEKTIQTGSIRVMDNKGNAEIIVFYGMCGCFKKSR